MKKRVLALLFGGVIAVGSLVLQKPVEVQAVKFDSCDNSSSHIKSSGVELVDGKLKVTIDIDFETEKGKFGLYVFEKKLVKEGEFIYLDMEDASRVAKLEDLRDSGTYTLDGFAEGKTYYVYCRAEDNHECNGWGEGGNENDIFWHDAAFLGSVSAGSSSGSSCTTSSSGNGESAWTSYEGTVKNQIVTAQSGSTVVLEKGISAVSNSMMKELLAKGDVSLKLEFTYKDQEYVIIIPAGAALDNDVPWYGPLYLAEKFGNRAGTENTAVLDTTASATQETSAENPVSTVYEVHSGDTLSKIAAANHMTLSDLLAKNPQIKDPGRIRVGQQINL